jgi:hypothetical protein
LKQSTRTDIIELIGSKNISVKLTIRTSLYYPAFKLLAGQTWCRGFRLDDFSSVKRVFPVRADTTRQMNHAALAVDLDLNR